MLCSGKTGILTQNKLMPDEFSSLFMMIAAGDLSNLAQPRYVSTTAVLAISLATHRFTSLTPTASFYWFARALGYQITGLPTLFLTINTYA